MSNMTESVDTFELMRKQLCNNLKLLSTEEFFRRSKENIEINPQTFVRLTPKVFQLITYHLFHTLNSEECRKRFIGSFPVKDRKQEGEFRQISYKWLLEITLKETKYQFPRVVPIYFQHFTPEIIVCQLYLDFSNYVLLEAIRGITCGTQQFKLGDTNDTESNLNNYQSIVEQIRQETKESLDQIKYFGSTYGQLCQSLNEYQEKRSLVLNSAKEKYKSDDQELKELVDTKLKNLKDSITKIRLRLTQLSELAARHHNSYSIAINSSQTSPSTELFVDLNKWFDKSFQNSFASKTKLLMSQLKTIDRKFQTVSSDSMEELNIISDKFLKELENGRLKLDKVNFQMVSMMKQSEGLSQKKRAQLLSSDELRERRKWFADRIVDITKLKFRLELKPKSTNEKQEKTEVAHKEKRDSIELLDDSPVFRPRPSLLDYSFQVMDISTCQYIPPTGCPLSMNDSHLFSPIDKDSDIPNK